MVAVGACEGEFAFFVCVFSLGLVGLVVGVGVFVLSAVFAAVEGFEYCFSFFGCGPVGVFVVVFGVVCVGSFDEAGFFGVVEEGSPVGVVMEGAVGASEAGAFGAAAESLGVDFSTFAGLDSVGDGGLVVLVVLVVGVCSAVVSVVNGISEKGGDFGWCE